MSLGFDIDQRRAVSIAHLNLESVEAYLDRENAILAENTLISSKDIILELNDEELSIKYELLECRCLQKLERVDEARDKYINISKRFPKDPRAFLYLAGIFLHDEDFSENKKLLEKAENIDNDYWLLKLEKLVRKNNLGEEIDVKNIDENTFTDDPKIKADFYRLYAIFFEQSGDKTNADSFIEKAIHLNPDRFANYSAKLSILESRLHSNQDNTEILTESQELLEETTKVEKKFLEYGDIGPRNKAILNSKRLFALLIQEDFPKLKSVAKETFQLFISCYLDKEIEQLLTQSLQFVLLSDTEFNQMLEYLKNSKLVISDELSKVLIFQFNINNNLLTDGKKFFEEINNLKFSEFIRDIEKENHESILEFLNSDPMFAVTMANTLREHPELRKKIIENLPDDKNIQKEKLSLLLNFDENDFDEAFNILKQLDLSNLSYLDCLPIFQIAKQKKAWEFLVIVVQKLLNKESNEYKRFNLQLTLFNAFYYLNKYPEVIDLGEQLLQRSFNKEIIIPPNNKEALVINTIIACFERGKIDQDALKRAKKIIEEYKLIEPSFEFKVGIEAEVYLQNNDANNALKSVIEGLRIKKSLTNIEYANLFFLLATKIAEKVDLNLDSLDKVCENTFVKLNNKHAWYFVGNDNALDAIPVSRNSSKYEYFIDKKIGDKIFIKSEYGSEDLDDVVDNIFSIEKYALWKARENFHNLSKEGDLEGVQMIKIPQEEETTDLRNLLKFLENTKKKTEPFFKEYYKKTFPLSMLAVNEGSLTNAIGRIQNEQKGYIHCSTGNIEFLIQKEIAKKVILEKMPFYLDGTSALFLSEIGLYKEVHTYLPNLKVPQSVISLLADIADQFGNTVGQVGNMIYAQGRLSVTLFDEDKKAKRKLIQSNIIQSIKLLESKPENIDVISSANKAECFSEKEIPSELIDACILAQKEQLPILTDDYLNLKLNELQTSKKAPDYFSSFALTRVLYEEHLIGFDQYLKYFGFLSSYRVRFLSLNSDDIEKAVFGDGDIVTVNPENIRNLNFTLTLSEEYGVSFDNAFRVVWQFFVKVLIGNKVTPDIAVKIFIEILECFPSKMNKKDFGQMLLRSSVKIIEENQSEFLISPINEIFNETIDKLQQATEIYTESKLWVPS